MNLLIEQVQPEDIVCVLGDVFDNRNSITHKAMALGKKLFEELSKNCKQIHIILGNHDIHFTNRLFPNSVHPLLEHISNVTIYTEPTELLLGANKVLLVPWIVPDRMSSVEAKIKASSASICMGHFDIIGFNFNKTTVNKNHGFDPKVFNKFDQVYTGHYHISSEMKNILYMGAQYQMTWDDWGEEKYFISILENDGTDIAKYYTDSELFIRVNTSNMSDVESAVYEGKYVKLLHDSAEDSDLRIAKEHILSQTPFDLSIEHKYDSKSSVSVSENVQNALGGNNSIKDVVKEISASIEMVDENLDEDRVRFLLDEIIEEAHTLELNEE